MKTLILTLCLSFAMFKGYSQYYDTTLVGNVYLNQDSNEWYFKIEILNSYTMRCNDSQIMFFTRYKNSIVLVENMSGSLEIIEPDKMIGHAFLKGTWIKL